MNLKKFNKIILLIVLFLMIGMVSVNASVEKVLNFTFDSEAYANGYNDLRVAYGTDANKLKEHFANYGVSEGRVASPVFDVKYYVNHYADLKAAYGTDYEAAYNHFLNYGMAEGRLTSPVFDVRYYIDNNADIKAAYGTDYEKAYNHFANWGMAEGRKTSANFDVRYYAENYADLKAAYGTDYEKAYNHYLNYGMTEGRVTVAPEAPVIPEHVHSYDAGVVTTQPTCTVAGVKTYTCKGCKETKTETIKALGHDMKENGEATKATCTEDGVQNFKCSRCDEATTEVVEEAKGHEYVKTAIGASAEAATCAKEGTYYNKCSVCGSEEKTINSDGEEVVKIFTGKLDHNFSLLTADVAASCTNGGYKLYTCSACGVATQSTEVSSALPHEMTKVDAKEVSCTENGNVEYYTCKTCPFKYADEKGKEKLEEVTIAAKGHTYTSTVTKEATCEATGEKTATCSVCGYINPTKETIKAAGHDYVEVAAKEVTCAEDGNVKYYTCKNCTKIFDDKKVETTIANVTISKDTVKHDFDEVITPATATSCQKTTRICKDCGYTEVDSEHTKGSKNADATCTTPAKYICSKCGTIYESDDVADAALGHKYQVTEAATCTKSAKVKCLNEKNATEVEYSSELTGKFYNDAEATDEVADVKALEATGHTVEAVPAETVSCENDGIKENTFKCSKCDAYYTTVDSDGKVVDATTNGAVNINNQYYLPTTKEAVTVTKLGHDYDSVVTKEATCDATGTITYTCKNDESHTYTETIPAKGHNFSSVVAATDSTCDVQGNVAYAVCNNCKKYYKVTDATETTENAVKIGAKYYTIEESTEDGVKKVLDSHDYVRATIMETSEDKSTAKVSFLCDKCNKGVVEENVPLTKVEANADLGMPAYYTVAKDGVTYYFTEDFKTTTTVALGID